MKKLLTLVLLAFVITCFSPTAGATPVKTAPAGQIHKKHHKHRKHRHRHHHHHHHRKVIIIKP